VYDTLKLGLLAFFDVLVVHVVSNTFVAVVVGTFKDLGLKNGFQRPVTHFVFHRDPAFWAYSLSKVTTTYLLAHIHHVKMHTQQ
jgi:hypothetical protein